MTWYRSPPLLLRLTLSALFLFGCYNWYSTSIYYAALGSDFLQDYVAGHQLRHGQTIYGESMSQAARSILGFPGFENFHPPFLALPFALVSFLPYHQAVLLLNILSLLAYLGIVILLVRELQIPRALLWYLLPPLLFWHPFLEVIALGQTSLLIALMIVGGWILLRRSYSFWGGACLGAACMMKLFPGLLLVYLLSSRNWRACIGWLLVVIFWGLLTLLCVGPADMLRYVSDIAPRDAQFWSMFPANASLRGFILPLISSGRWTTPIVDLGTLAPVLVSAFQAIFGLCIVTWMFLGTSCRRGDDASFAILVVASVLLSPLAWTHNLVLLLLPLMLMLKARLVSSSHSALPLIVALALFSLPTYELLRNLQAAQLAVKLSPLYFLLTRGGFAGLIIVFFWLYRSHKASAPLEVRGVTGLS